MISSCVLTKSNKYSKLNFIKSELNSPIGDGQFTLSTSLRCPRWR